jgi:hypothetical protein
MEQRSTSLRLGSQSQKLIPRDISDSLGKLPPQALDLEEAVLGAVMLDMRALADIPYLKSAHFYDDRHKEIFTAILQLRQQSVNPDMKAVVAKLREIGKIELIGGAYYIAELTSKVSSAASVDYHARVIVEMSMKRSLIEIASQIHHDAYEDTTDVFELFQKTQEDISFLLERETKSSGPERIAKLWEKYKIVEKPVRPETLIKLGDADVCTVGNLSLLVGKKKSRKSLLVTHLLHIFLRSRENTGDDILVFDTEQEEYDVWAAKDRLYRMTNMHIPFFCLRGLSPKERREFIEQTITHWPGRRPRIAVIDGIRDCMSNINDPDESTEVLSWLMKLNVESRIHFINVLHLNKTDNNARGHIGTELLNKAEVTIEVSLDEKSQEPYPPSVVRCESSRRKPFEPFMFTHNESGLPELLGAPAGSDNKVANETITKLVDVFEGQALKHKELLAQVRDHFGLGETKAKRLIVMWVKRGWILKSGPDRSPNTSYKLMATPGSYTPPPKIEEPPQLDLQMEQPKRDDTPPHSATDELPF